MELSGLSITCSSANLAKKEGQPEPLSLLVRDREGEGGRGRGEALGSVDETIDRDRENRTLATTHNLVRLSKSGRPPTADT